MAATIQISVLSFIILGFILNVTAHYNGNDDSDYNDFDFYENLPSSYERGANENYRATGPDDFYIISDFDEIDRATGPSSLPTEDYIDKIIFDNNESTEKISSPSASSQSKNRGKNERDRDWYKRPPEKIYRYTKHRIPGYDYDEFDFMAGGGSQQCNEKSIWTNCLCQFTCYEPNIVDCFTPCRSGCECKEDYVFDEVTQQCILPEKCSDVKDYIIYKK